MLSEAARALWAKSDPRHELWRHLLDIAAVSRALIPLFWRDSPIPDRWVWLLVAFHDVGKADALFQMKAPDAIDPALKEAGFFDGVDQQKSKGFRHEARSAEWLQPYLKKRGWNLQSIQTVACAVRGHHGDFDPRETSDELAERWNPLREVLAELIREVIQPDTDYHPKAFDQASAIGLMLSGLIVLSDWIASGEEFYSGIPKDDDPKSYFEAGSARAQEFVDRLNFKSESTLSREEQPLKFEDVWHDITDLRPSQETLQNQILQGITPGLAIYEAPMGEGKTEGAVYLEEEWNRQRNSSGTYIALPTMATSNQMHLRYSEYLAKRSPKMSIPRLTHGMAWLMGDELPEAPTTGDPDQDHEDLERIRMWFAPAKRALLAPEGVGTVDQTLMAALKVKHGFLRLFGLSRKVLIVDEVHAYDAYMQTILQRLLHWCSALQIPVILLSATLSSGQKRALVKAYSGFEPPITNEPEPYPLLTFVPLKGQAVTVPVQHKYEQKNIQVKLQSGLLEDVVLTARTAAGLVQDGGCLCVLVNTVRRSQDVFKQLKEMRGADNQPLFSDEELFLFHARFPARRRDTIEKLEVIQNFGPHPEDKRLKNPNRPRRTILVATQVVEQSLDVCFDVMLTDLAPIDLLLQRAGRLHRHAINPRYAHQQPVLHIALPNASAPLDFGRIELKRSKDGTWRGVYDRATLLKTLELLPRGVFELPKDFRKLIESVYNDSISVQDQKLETAIRTAQVSQAQRMAEFEAQARHNLIPPPDPVVFKYGQTSNAKDEAEEGQQKSYFRAQTRLGDDSRAVFVLTEQRLINAFKNACSRTRDNRQKRADSRAEGREPPKRYQPHIKFLKELFWQKANVPAWWLVAEPIEDFEKFVQNNRLEEENGDTLRLRWLRGHTVIIAPNCEWRGLMNEKPVTLRVDHTLGLLLENTPEQETPEGAEGA
jgi:CRISPR-associated endonuclease/helicase Cas3